MENKYTGKKIKVLLTNDFHNTASHVVLQPITEGRFAGYHKVSRNVAQRVKRDLCGISGCMCSDTFGSRGGNRLDITNEDYDRNYIIDIMCSHIEDEE